MRKIVLASMFFIFLYHGTLHAQAAPKENNAVPADFAVLRWDPSPSFDHESTFWYIRRILEKGRFSPRESYYSWTTTRRWMSLLPNASAQRHDRGFGCYVKGYNIYLATDADILKKSKKYELIPGTYRVISAGMTATPKNPEYTVPGLAPGTYYFRVTAYYDCMEGDFGNMVSKKISPR